MRLEAPFDAFGASKLFVNKGITLKSPFFFSLYGKIVIFARWGEVCPDGNKKIMKRLFLIAQLLLLAVAIQSQAVKQLKIYQKSGVVDTVYMSAGSLISHSRLDMQ